MNTPPEPAQLNCSCGKPVTFLLNSGDPTHLDGSPLCNLDDAVSLRVRDLPKWAALKTSVESAEERGRVPAGFAATALVLLILAGALGCLIYFGIVFHASGVEFP